MNESKLKLRAGQMIDLARYVATQLHNLFPDEGIEQDLEMMLMVLPRALERMRPILGAVRAFEPNFFNHFNSLQYATFLYFIGNEHWRLDRSALIADRLFCLNRALSAMDLFHGVEMPEVFFVSHGVGSVLGNATYGNRLVFFQNVTVGRVENHRPIIGENVVLFSGATITGRAQIGNNSVVTAGAIVHGITVPDNVVVMPVGSEIAFLPLKRDYINLYLRPP
jgi:serine O-acetyltransferase